MKTTALAFAIATLAANAQIPAVGSQSENVAFAIGSNFDSDTNNYQTLENNRLSDRPNKVLVLGYATPW